MKLVNKDITYITSREELDNVLDNVYKNERKYQSSKQHMRLRWNRGKNPLIEWWDDLSHNRNELYGLIDSFIRKRVGRKFDDVYSEFLKDPRFKDSNMNWTQRPRDIFKDYIMEDKRFCRWRSTWRDTYIVDSDGYIRINPDKFVRKKNRNLIIRKPYEEREVRYAINHINVYRLRDAIIQHWGWDKYLRLINNTYLTKEQYQGEFFKLIFDFRYSGHANSILEYSKNIEGCVQFLKRGYFSYGRNDLKELLFREMYAPNEEYIYGTREYYIKLSELKKLERKTRKARKHPNRSAYDYTLKYYSKPSNRRRKREQARSKQKDT